MDMTLKEGLGTQATAAQQYNLVMQRKERYVVQAVREEDERLSYHRMKRLFDLCASLFGMAVCFVPMLAVAAAIKADSEGPVIYSQQRLGKDAEPFRLYKFRSMVNDAEKHGARWAAKDDDRVTRVGRFLRKTRMDELPQLVNIFLGHMSIVGPRPERECFYELFELYIPGFRQRLRVRPGLTGWAQVNGGYDLKPEEKIIYDMEYINKRSFRMDLRCIWLTAKIVFSHDGAR